MEDNFELILRMVVASLIGIAIGAEREYRAKEAGIRTHFLVSLGSALFMIVSEYAFIGLGINFDPARVAAQVVTGIGFLGAGTIIIQKQNIRGLTTAAGLWVTAGIGMATGAGMYLIGISAAVLALAAFELLNWFVRNIGYTKKTLKFYTSDRDIIRKILADGFICSSCSIEENPSSKDDSDMYIVYLTMDVKSIGKKKISDFFERYPQITSITGIN